MQRLKSWAILAWLLSGSSLHGAVLRVPSQYATVQAGMSAATAGDSVLVAPGLYTNCDGGPCTANVVVMKPGVLLLSESGPSSTILRVDVPSGGLAVVYGASAPNAVLGGFTVQATAGSYRGAVFLNSVAVRIENCRFEDLSPGVQDGAGVKVNNTSITILDCAFQRCEALQEGGGFKSIAGPTVMERVLFEDCVKGGAIIVGPGGTTTSVRDCVFRNNSENTALTVIEMSHAEVIGNVFIGNSSGINAPALVIGGVGPTGSSLVRDNLFAFNSAIFQARAAMSWNSPGEISGNTFFGNSGSPGSESASALKDISPGYLTVLENNIFAGNENAPAFRALFVERQGACNLFWSNPGGDYAGYTPSPTDLFVDPQFCDPLIGDFSLRSTSPCLPEHSGDCGLIGAFGQGCGTVAVDHSSWGRIKATFRRGETR